MFNEIFDKFLDGIDGFDSFFNGVASVKNNYKLVYGEFNQNSFDACLDILRDFYYINKNKKVLDLGSGIGKVVMAMHYTDYFKQVDGIEIVDTLVEDSKKCIGLYSKLFNKDVSNINIYQGDFKDFDISDYDVIISNTTTDDRIREMLKNKIIKEAKRDAMIITSITRFEDKKLKQIRKITTSFSWGISCINACIKL